MNINIKFSEKWSFVHGKGKTRSCWEREKVQRVHFFTPDFSFSKGSESEGSFAWETLTQLFALEGINVNINININTN